MSPAPCDSLVWVENMAEAPSDTVTAENALTIVLLVEESVRASPLGQNG